MQNLGDGLTLPIPQAFAERVGIVKDSLVEISIIGDTLTVTPATSLQLNLASLSAQVTEENLHTEVSSG